MTEPWRPADEVAVRLDASDDAEYASEQEKICVYPTSVGGVDMQFIDGVDIPEEVLRAHSSGKLVLFVGAGASKSDPSSLPLFDKLALQLGARAREPFDDAHRDKIDRYIGSLPSGFDAHRHAAEILQPDGSAPNDVHRALVSLASCAGVARIVTTNFDNHSVRLKILQGVSGSNPVSPAEESRNSKVPRFFVGEI